MSSIADASVRVAWTADAEAIAAVQVRAWQTTYADLLPAEVVTSADEAAIAAHWRDSLHRPLDARNRALVVLSGSTVVGFAATAPADDPDADPIADGAIIAFHIDPDATGRGHGSRLLNASVETLRADGFRRGLIWLFAADDAMRAFLTGAGWAPDGAFRELAAGDSADGDGAESTDIEVGEVGAVAEHERTKQIRLHCSLLDEESAE